MGVILYALLCGTLPFDDESIPNLFKKIKSGKEPCGVIKDISLHISQCGVVPYHHVTLFIAVAFL